MTSAKVTNQQLAFARVQADAASAATTALARRSHCQAGILQLDLALQAYARELLEVTKQKIPLRYGRGMFTHLANALRALGHASAELDELVHLEQAAGSWLAIQQNWAGRATDMTAEVTAASIRSETSLTALEAAGNASSIKLVDVDANGSKLAPTQDTLQELVHSAGELIRRQREQAAEY